MRYVRIVAAGVVAYVLMAVLEMMSELPAYTYKWFSPIFAIVELGVAGAVFGVLIRKEHRTAIAAAVIFAPWCMLAMFFIGHHTFSVVDKLKECMFLLLLWGDAIVMAVVASRLSRRWLTKPNPPS